MTQPASKLGPVSFGGSERYGNSAQGIWETLEDIQKSAKGCAEWIDGLATSGGPNPSFAHDHRGGVWGRPLGVGHCVPMRPGGGSSLEAITFINVPDVSSPNGNALPTTSSNGGYQFVDLYVYHNAAAGAHSLRLRTSTWVNGVWSAPNETVLTFTAAGGGAVWTQTESFQAPAGLVRVELYNVSSIIDWHWSSFVIPQR
jgi:hypothetical protein